jgi:hypothetical protein
MLSDLKDLKNLTGIILVSNPPLNNSIISLNRGMKKEIEFLLTPAQTDCSILSPLELIK